MEFEENLLEAQEQPEFIEKSVSQTPLIYSWGRNQEGQLAHRQNSQNVFVPTPPKALKGITKQIVSGRSHSALLTTAGKIYVCGSLLFGRLGVPTKTAKVNNYREFRPLKDKNLTNQNIIKLACGDFHTLALTDKGLIFSWGGTLWDKTGHKTQGIVEITKLKGKNIIDIACGDFHSLALDDRGKVYSWGGGGSSKNKGQLGHGNLKDISQPEEIKFFADIKVKQIACGDYHTMIMTDEDEIYAFGEGVLGQLGTGGKQDCPHPRKVNISLTMNVEEYFDMGLQDEKTCIKQICLGGKHSLLLTNKGHLYVCGFGSQGQLGLAQGLTSNKYEPTLVRSLLGKNIIMVAAGSNHSLALTSKSDVFSCGHNSKGQLGLGESKSCTVWTHVSSLSHKRVAFIYGGGEHSWAVIDESQPILENYRPPSPIRVAMDYEGNTVLSRNSQNQNQLSSRPPMPNHQSVSGNNSMDEILVELNSNRKLELILTQTAMFHRFIHFTLKKDPVRNYKKKIEDFIRECYEEEKEMRMHKFSQDGEVTDENGEVRLAADPKGCTIMLVASCEVDSYSELEGNAPLPKNKISVGEMVLLSGNMLKCEGKIPTYNNWFFKFCDRFDDLLEKARFIELRPKLK